MTDQAYDPASRRSRSSRIGITALNLVTPGLGLFRVGRWRSGMLFLAAPFSLAAVFVIGLGHLPGASYGIVLSAAVLAITLMAMLYIVPMVMTWRASGVRSPERPWSRWYGLLAITAIILGLWQLAAPLPHRFYKPFYAPSASMAPTIDQGDKFVVDMRWRGAPERGDIVVFESAGTVRVSRVAAIGGDEIAMRAGVPIINGVAAIQRPYGKTRLQDYGVVQMATLSTERLPGEKSVHRVLDADVSLYDKMPKVVVPQGRFFVLGDNRDRSADSRVALAQLGVGMVPVAAIIGRPLYIYWSGDHAKIGNRLDR